MKYQWYLDDVDKAAYIGGILDVNRIIFESLGFLEIQEDLDDLESSRLIILPAEKIESLDNYNFGKNNILIIAVKDEESAQYIENYKFALCNYGIFLLDFYTLLTKIIRQMKIQKRFFKVYYKYLEKYNRSNSALRTICDLTECEAMLIDKKSGVILRSEGINKELLTIESYKEKDIEQNKLVIMNNSAYFFWDDQGIVLISGRKRPSKDCLVPLLIAKAEIVEIFDDGQKIERFYRYSKLLEDAISGKIDTLVFYEELKQIETHNNNQKPFYFWILISYTVNCNPLTPEKFYEKLESIFGMQYIGKVRNSFHILLRSDNNNRRFPKELLKPLQNFLEENNAFCVISGCGYRYERIKTTLLMNLPVMHLGITFRENKAERIFFFQEYSIHFLIDFFAKYYKTYYPETGVKYLVPGSVYSLYIYDERNDTNLVEVLYTWLMNQQNAKRTSEKLFMHRNTVDKKLRLIEKISGHSLDDFQFQYQAIFSYLVINYYEKMQNKNFEVRILPEY